jgi:hypothetical protein
MRARLLALVPVFAAILGTTAVVPASADGLGIGRLRTHYKSGEIVTAFSRFGNGSIQSVVRRAPNGWQVRLPSGNWTYCRRSCEETLRVQTIDYYEGGNSIDDGGYGSLSRECGIFGCLGGSYTFSF